MENEPNQINILVFITVSFYSHLRAFPMHAEAFEFREFFHHVQAALSKATETRKPSGPKISCKVSKVGLPFLERIL